MTELQNYRSEIRRLRSLHAQALAEKLDSEWASGSYFADLSYYQRSFSQQRLMLRTIEGIYQDGKVELTEQPQTTGDRVQVLVTFLDANSDPAKLRQLIDQLETIAGLQQGFEEMNAGQTRPISQFTQEMQQKYGISG